VSVRGRGPVSGTGAPVTDVAAAEIRGAFCPGWTSDTNARKVVPKVTAK
jgi:hypothetical protein